MCVVIVLVDVFGYVLSCCDYCAVFLCVVRCDVIAVVLHLYCYAFVVDLHSRNGVCDVCCCIVCDCVSTTCV